MFASMAGSRGFFASLDAVVRVTVFLAGFALSNPGGFNPMEVAWGAVGVAFSSAIPGELVFLGTITAEDTPPGFRRVRGDTKGRVLPGFIL
jgi:hypothetical protein